MHSAGHPDPAGEPVIIHGNLLARKVQLTARGDGQLWFLDWERRILSLEARGSWAEIKCVVLCAGLAPADLLL